ncbi:MAG: type II toxin-antitoxin system Phd/YefM family antitoxin [Kiritimatiellia bacterium]|nr:type II toxin-antitoxin system Phd/YefM family antitoxin [Kiritimatiellia bacterium]
MITVSTMEVRKSIGHILNRVALRGDEYLVERKGKPMAVMMPVEKAEAIRRAARLRLGEWLIQPNGVGTDEKAMALANEARRASRTSRRKR